MNNFLEPSIIEYAVLKPDSSPEEIQNVCVLANKHSFKSISVSPYFVATCRKEISEYGSRINTVIGYPYGFSITSSKVEEIKRAINDGADGLEVVMNISAVKSRNVPYLKNDIESCVRISHLKGKPITMTIESSLFEEEEIKMVCELCTEYEVNFIKTSTGLYRLPTEKDINTIKKNIPNSIKILASGNDFTLPLANQLIDAGAVGISTASPLNLIKN